MTLRTRIAKLEADVVPDEDPPVVFVSFVGAKDGRPDGRCTDWSAHAPIVIVNEEPHAVAAGESAEEAVRRIVAAMRPKPHGAVARLPTEWNE